MGETSGPTSAESPATTRRPLRIAVSTLLIVLPVSLALAVPLYQRTEPTLIGMPFFYWFQLGMTVLTALATSTVYRLLFTGDRDGEGDA